MVLTKINEEHIAWRNEYLLTLIYNRNLPRSDNIREIYKDESYVHHHYKNEIYDFYIPETEKVEGKTQSKGRRYCFVPTIGGDGNYDKAGLVPGSLWSFCLTFKKDHNGDYHKFFNRGNYVNWFKNYLLTNLIEPSLIILDNARYYKCKSTTVPNPSKLRKADVLKV